MTPEGMMQRMHIRQEQAYLVHEELQKIAAERAAAATSMPNAAPDVAAADAEAAAAADVQAMAAEAESEEVDADVQRYYQLQQHVTQLQGMQICMQMFQVQRRVSAAEQQLEAMQKLVQESREAVQKAQLAYEKLEYGEWYPGKHLLQNKDAKVAAAGQELERCNKALHEREQQAAEITTRLQDSSRRYLLWKGKEAELEAALQELSDLESLLFETPAPSDAQSNVAVVNTLCTIEEGSASTAAAPLGEGLAHNSEAAEGLAAEGEQQAQVKPKVGRVLTALADSMGQVDPLKHRDRFGGWGRGRLLRITADKLQRAAEARGKEREAGMCRVQGSIGARGGDKPGVVPADLMHLFPKDACSFNPAIDCKPSTFLWPYSHRFMGKLHKLQTGPVLQAFYRFGPFDVDPDHAERLIPAGNGGAPPLILLSGLGSTMIAWGTPLLRALATSHEVIIMEYRGAGLSKNLSDQPWSYYNQAEAVLLLADALNIPKFNWLGWSSGGNTGLVLAALFGNRLGRMASHAGMAGGPDTIVPPAYDMLHPDLSLSLGQTMALIFPPDDPADFKASCADYIKNVFSMPGAITDQEVGRQAAQEQWRADQEFIRRDGRVWDALPTVRIPCLIMNGDRDVLVPHENAVRIAQRIPGAQLHTWEGWGHGFKDSQRFAQVVTDFLLSEG